MTDTVRRYLPGEAQRAEKLLVAALGGPDAIPPNAGLAEIAAAAAGTIVLYGRAIASAHGGVPRPGFPVRQYAGLRLVDPLGDTGDEVTDADRLADALREARQAAGPAGDNEEARTAWIALELALARWPEVTGDA